MLNWNVVCHQTMTNVYTQIKLCCDCIFKLLYLTMTEVYIKTKVVTVH